MKSRSLLFSFYIEPNKSRDDWGWIPLIVGLAVTNVLNRQSNVFKTKWPNDVLAINSRHDGKVAGILSEVRGSGVVVGVGLNVCMEKDELPVDTATSVTLVGGEELDRNVLLAEILKECATLISRWEAGVDLRMQYIGLSATISKRVEVHGIDGDSQMGMAVDIGPHAELVLEDGQHIYSGDVIHLYT